MSEIEDVLARLALSKTPVCFWQNLGGGSVGSAEEMLVYDGVAVSELLRGGSLISDSVQTPTKSEDFLGWFDSMSILRAHGKRHARLRSPIVRALHASQDEISAVVARTSAFYARQIVGKGRMTDFVTDFAEPVSSEIAGSLLGLSPDQAREAGALAESINAEGLDADGDLESARASMERLLAFAPRGYASVVDDAADSEGAVLRHLAKFAQIEGWSPEEWQCNTIMLFTAGYLTSRDALSCIPIAMEQLPLASEVQICDFILTWHSPIQIVERFASDDVKSCGLRIDKGARVVLAIGAAVAQQGPQMAFGLGAHFCAGARVARLELTSACAAFRELSAKITVSATSLREEVGSFGFSEVWVAVDQDYERH